MSVLFYSGVRNGAGKRVQRIIENLVPKDQMEVYRTTESLSRRLRQPTYNLKIAVLFAVTRKDLSEIFSIRDLFSQIHIILILPDQESETIAKGHKMYPRFISYIDGDFKVIAAVLEKMMNRKEVKNKWQK